MPISPQQSSDGWTRREMLRVSGLSLFGLNLLDPFRGGQTQAMPLDAPDPELMPLLGCCRGLHRKIHAEMAKVHVGQTQLVDEVLMALFCNGHVLLTGAPGAPRNLTLGTLSRVLGLSFGRIQHSFDLLPEDITGVEVSDRDNAQSLQTWLGPIFANMVLADCFDCAPPTTQAAMFRAMQERQVKIGGQTLPLGRPFLVMVMENPREGKYPLDDSHRTRFMFNTCFTAPSEAAEYATLALCCQGGFPPAIETVLSRTDIEQIQTLVRRMPVSEAVAEYALRLVRLTRPGQTDTPAFVRSSVIWGSGPRGAHFLIRAARAYAVLHGQPTASIEGVRAAAPAVLRHRIVLNANAQSQGLDGNQIIVRLLEELALRQHAN